jgi:hypothetical protein
MYLKLGKWDRVNGVKMMNFAVQVRRNRFPCRDNPVPHSKNQRRDF